MGKKRASNEEEKRSKRARTGAAPPNDTPPGAQAPRSSTASSAARAITNEPRNTRKQKIGEPQNGLADSKPSHETSSRRQDRKKLPRLPSNAYIAKRPLHRSAIPTPFASSDHLKTLYISHSTPFVPTLKRIRRLLLEISKRKAQSQAAQPRHWQQGRTHKPLIANGRLAPEDVEREIADTGRDKSGGGGEEEVFVKATGRAIERALRVGLHFQGESDCRVTVEMGSVMAVDDIEVRLDEDQRAVEKSIRAKEETKDEQFPETRVRMLSSVTVAVRLR